MKTWRVVKIIDNQRLVINAGSSDGIKKGQEMVVFLPGEEVIDPETKQSLGTLDTIKCYLNVTDVYEKMSICVNAISNMSDVFGIAGAFALGGLSGPKALPVDAEDISGGLQPKTRIVIGDLVRLGEI